MGIEQVVLVDHNGKPMGTEEKLNAHRRGVLHLAFSVFIFNSNQQMLLQRRATEKYHSPNLWTNTCCSHPRQHETVLEAANRRLDEEMGMHCDLTPMFTFTYRAELDQQMIEHEFDHVLFGVSDVEPIINPAEVSQFRYVSLTEIETELRANPDQFTEWFKIAFERIRQHWLAQLGNVA